MYERAYAFFLFFVSSLAGGLYIRKFFAADRSRKRRFLIWMLLYFVFQYLILDKMSIDSPLLGLAKAATDILIVFGLLLLLYDRELLKLLFVAVSFVAGKEIIKYIIIVVSYGLNGLACEVLSRVAQNITTMKQARLWSFCSTWFQWSAILILYVALMSLYFAIISRKFTDRERPFQIQEYSFLILPSATTLCVSITLKMIFVSVEKGVTVTLFDKVPATMFWVPFLCLLLLCVNISSITLFQKLLQLNEEEKKRSLLENQTIQIQQELEEIQDIYADMRGLQHDMRNHLESVASAISRTTGDTKEELAGYLNQMKGTVNRLDFAYRTGNPITDAILQRKAQDARKKQIAFYADFAYPDRHQFDVYDIGIVLNNALENAIEAAGRAKGAKEISLRSYKKGHLFFIEVENTFSGDFSLDERTGLPTSSKKDGKPHGIGLENIQRCARKYRGDMDITVSGEGEKRFILTVMMYEQVFKK